MFDIGWAELMVIGCLALIVVGPRDLPKLLRSFGQYVNQARGMAREFQRSMEDAAREADISQIKEIRQTAADLRNIKNTSLDSMMNPKPAASKPTTAAPAPTVATSPQPAPSPEPAPPAGGSA